MITSLESTSHFLVPMHVSFGVLIYEERISLYQENNPVRFRKGFEIWKKKKPFG